MPNLRKQTDIDINGDNGENTGKSLKDAKERLYKALDGVLFIEKKDRDKKLMSRNSHQHQHGKGLITNYQNAVMNRLIKKSIVFQLHRRMDDGMTNFSKDASQKEMLQGLKRPH